MTEPKEQRAHFVDIMDLFLNVKIRKKYLGWISTGDCQNRFFDEDIAMNKEIGKEKMEGEGDQRTLEELEATESWGTRMGEVLET